MIEVSNISKTFGSKNALNDASFTLRPGEIAALIGENGAGKSTLLSIMSVYVQASSV